MLLSPAETRWRIHLGARTRPCAGHARTCSLHGAGRGREGPCIARTGRSAIDLGGGHTQPVVEDTRNVHELTAGAAPSGVGRVMRLWRQPRPRAAGRAALACACLLRRGRAAARFAAQSVKSQRLLPITVGGSSPARWGAACGSATDLAGMCGLDRAGTSLPDTLASRIAAVEDADADAAIGNITGSNCVNVFLGLGLPWVICSVYYKLKVREVRACL